MRNDIVAKRRKDLELNELEALWLEIRYKNKKFLLCTAYRPPGLSNFYDIFQSAMDKGQQSNMQDYIIIGDLNSDPNTHTGDKLNTFASLNRLKVHINQPTRITDRSSSILDQCLSNCPLIIRTSGIIPPLANNDHCTIYVKLTFKIKQPKPFKRHIWKFSEANTDGYKSFLDRVKWDECFQGKSIDQTCDNITNIILSAAKQFIPNKVVTIRPYDKSFYNHHLRQLKYKLNRLRNKAKNTNTPDIWAKFRSERNIYIREVQKAKSDFSQSKFDKINTENLTSKKFSGLTKSIISSSRDSTIPPLITDSGDIIVDDYGKANHFNKFFTQSSVVDDTSASIPSLNAEPVPMLSDIVVQEEEVLDQIKILDCNKSYGPDSISPRFIKMAGLSLVKPLTLLFNTSLSNGIFPSNWKKANVLPLHKKSSKQYADNYRPVSLLCILGKIFERIIFKHVYNHFWENSLISRWQSGFLPGFSTVTQLLEMYHQFYNAINEGKDVRIVYLDISKAFDRVWHKGLLFKLNKFGIGGKLLKWFSDYLSNRYQRVIINGQCSDWLKVTAGVPQGSVLDPLLFLVFINDITSVVKYCDIRLFADDTCLFLKVINPAIATTCINKDLLNIEKWANQWLIKFSPSKTESSVISLKQNSRNNYKNSSSTTLPLLMYPHTNMWGCGLHII